MAQAEGCWKVPGGAVGEIQRRGESPTGGGGDKGVKARGTASEEIHSRIQESRREAVVLVKAKTHLPLQGGP